MAEFLKLDLNFAPGRALRPSREPLLPDHEFGAASGSYPNAVRLKAQVLPRTQALFLSWSLSMRR